jgi:hypothetical protein
MSLVITQPGGLAALACPPSGAGCATNGGRSAATAATGETVPSPAAAAAN